MQFTFSKVTLPKSGTLAVLAGDGAKLLDTATQLDKDHGGFLKRAIKASRFEGKRSQILDVPGPEGLTVSRVLVVGLGGASTLDPLAAESIGGRLAAQLLSGRDKTAAVAIDLPRGARIDAPDFATHLAAGASLRDYRFDKYRTRKDPETAPAIEKVTVMLDGAGPARTAFKALEAGVAGTKLARDLVSEPPNILHTKEFTKRCQALSKLGVSVEVLGEKDMKKLGMGSLLAVGAGSMHESQLVIMQWNGKGSAKPASRAKSTPKKTAKGPDAPLVFVGKGVCFDAGGVSIKPAGGMEDMKGDMGGAAAVTGLMHALAARNAKVNVIGIVGLVENMVDSSAMRPGDILTSMSGQTIEVVNTDAEGRLVLADALWYAQDRFNPRFMIDLATLTGAIVNTFGNEYAGLFSDDNTIAEQLFRAGMASGEKVWRQPMGEAYDKLLDSQFADMKNTGPRPGGSITAAHFLKRYTNGVPWAHIDIASTAWSSKASDTSPAWATGFGVRLLDRFLADNYE